MTKIGEAHINVVLTETSPVALESLETLKAILATLKRIEGQGKPRKITNFQIFPANGTSIDEDVAAKLASKELYHRIASDEITRDADGTAHRTIADRAKLQKEAEAEKIVAEAFIAQVESTPDGVPVQIGQCGACTVCDCDD